MSSTEIQTASTERVEPESLAPEVIEPEAIEKKEIVAPPADSTPDQVDGDADQTNALPLKLNKPEALPPKKEEQAIDATNQTIVDQPIHDDNPKIIEAQHPDKTLVPEESVTTSPPPIKPSLPILPASPPQKSETPSNIQPSTRTQEAIDLSRIRIRGLNQYKVNASSLPKVHPDLSKTRVILDQPLSSMKPPDAMFVPHIYDARGRLLLRTLKNISPSTRTEKRFYDAFAAAKRQQSLPGQNHTAWNQNIGLRTRPKGKPANGFVFISSVFGTRPNPFGRGTEFHNGVDLVGAKGIPILATAAGRVVTRSRGRGYGIHVLLDHGSGYKTLYAHLSRKRVRPNQKVKRGQIIGYLGSTGRSTGPHLHYSVYHNQQAVDPRPYMYR